LATPQLAVDTQYSLCTQPAIAWQDVWMSKRHFDAACAEGYLVVLTTGHSAWPLRVQAAPQCVVPYEDPCDYKFKQARNLLYNPTF